MHMSRSIGVLTLFLLYHVCETKILHLGVRKKFNKWSCLALNDLIEFLNYRIYTAHEKEAIVPKFSAENLF